MNVLLVNPPPPSNERLFAIHPLGLLSLAAALRPAGHTVSILDLFSFGGALTEEQIRAHDIIGFSGMSFQHTVILALAQRVKRIAPEKLVIAGGSHASALPQLLLKEPALDFVLRGEAEESLVRLLENIQNPTAWPAIAGLCFRTASGALHIAPGALIADVASLPMPAWDLVDLRRYKGHHHGFFFEREPIGRVLSSRGCPFLCTFCASHMVSGRRFRPLPVSRVLDEIDLLYTTGNMRELQIEDDNFTYDAERAKEICRAILQRGYDLSISFPNGIRTERLDDELLSLMQRAGVYSVTFGIESGSPEILKRIKKGLSLPATLEQMRRVKKHGIYTQAFFIIGFPWETREDVLQTIQFSLRAPLDAAFFGSFVPLPGSEDFNELVDKGKVRLEEISWERLYSFKGIDAALYLSPLELKALRAQATRQFYLRPRILFTLLRRLRGLHQIRALLRRILATF